MQPILSVIIPTRERADYLAASLRTCIANSVDGLEILVLDNASRDNTAEVVRSFNDPRIRYVRSERRLSMRDNFEKGIHESRGRYLGFIGDDDGIFPFTPQRVITAFEEHPIEALSAARAHYAWPDLLLNRRGMALLPRSAGFEVRHSRGALRPLLRTNDYYRLPCIYHGFVTRAATDRVIARQGRFFVSSIVDCASTIALSLDDIPFGFYRSPLVINGGSRRSNGASQFGGGSETEQANWKVEDDLGYLPGFDDALTVGALIVETAARSVMANHLASIDDLLDISDVRDALEDEYAQRLAAGRSIDEAQAMFSAAGLLPPDEATTRAQGTRMRRVRKLAQSFLAQRPIDLLKRGVTDVAGAARVLTEMLDHHQTGLLSQPVEQVRAALRISG
jgi:glycosyltransferase involved in cell wall biosynthesis